LGIEVKF